MIFAVVVTFNRKALLLECIDSLLNQTYSVDKIIVIDNASTDGTTEAIEIITQNNPKVIYHKLDNNEGGAGGFSIGMRLAHAQSADWVWLMDDDAEPVHDSLERITSSVAFSAERTMAVAQLKVGADGEIQKVHRGLFDYKRLSTNALNEEQYKQSEVRIDYSSFVGILISKEAIEAVGFPNAEYFIWYDDVEYCLRMSEIGNIYLVRDSVIIHKDGLNRAVNQRMDVSNYWKSYYGHRNIIDIYLSHARGSALPFLLILYRLILDIIQIIIYDNYKPLRLKLLLKAHVDGFMGNLGKSIDPVIYRSNLKRSRRST